MFPFEKLYHHYNLKETKVIQVLILIYTPSTEIHIVYFLGQKVKDIGKKPSGKLIQHLILLKLDAKI